MADKEYRFFLAINTVKRGLSRYREYLKPYQKSIKRSDFLEFFCELYLI